MTILSKEDKISIINQHIRNAEYNKYNVQVSLIAENSVQFPNTDIVASLNTQLSEYDLKLEALQNEKASLEE